MVTSFAGHLRVVAVSSRSKISVTRSLAALLRARGRSPIALSGLSWEQRTVVWRGRTTWPEGGAELLGVPRIGVGVGVVEIRGRFGDAGRRTDSDVLKNPPQVAQRWEFTNAWNRSRCDCSGGRVSSVASRTPRWDARTHCESSTAPSRPCAPRPAAEVAVLRLVQLRHLPQSGSDAARSAAAKAFASAGFKVGRRIVRPGGRHAGGRDDEHAAPASVNVSRWAPGSPRPSGALVELVAGHAFPWASPVTSIAGVATAKRRSPAAGRGGAGLYRPPVHRRLAEDGNVSEPDGDLARG